MLLGGTARTSKKEKAKSIYYKEKQQEHLRRRKLKAFITRRTVRRLQKMCDQRLLNKSAFKQEY